VLGHLFRRLDLVERKKQGRDAVRRRAPVGQPLVIVDEPIERTLHHDESSRRLRSSPSDMAPLRYFGTQRNHATTGAQRKLPCDTNVVRTSCQGARAAVAEGDRRARATHRRAADLSTQCRCDRDAEKRVVGLEQIRRDCADYFIACFRESEVSRMCEISVLSLPALRERRTQFGRNALSGAYDVDSLAANVGSPRVQRSSDFR
jgi:hypothetical protein